VPTEERPRAPILRVKDAAERRDIAYLIDALKESEAVVRAAAAWDLGQLGASEAVPALVRNLNAKSDLVRNSSVIALGKIGDPAVIERLLEIAHTDEAAMVRLQAIDSLAMLNDPRGHEMLAQLAIDPASLFADASRWSDLPALRKQRQGTRRWTQKWAAKRLRELHVTQAVPILRSHARSAGLRQRLHISRTIRSLTRDQKARD
jgi:HEAT repeat protein